jgi:acyl-CoA reductase-like NAD-dependent aldehyde dehydrogenase
MAVIRDAQQQGAQLLVGGELLADGCITPAVLLGFTPNMQICQAELFGPAVAIAPYDTLDEAITQANNTPYGLQAGIFTRDLQAALYAAQRLDFGGVHINEVSSYRADHMPYGGVKASGMGREGPRYAIEEMSETKIIVITV